MHHRFWRNLTLIGLVHVAVIYGLMRWSRESKAANAQSIVWMTSSGGDGNSDAIRSERAAKPSEEVTSTPEPQPITPPDDADSEPALTATRSEIQLPTARPSATSSPKATPTAVVKATPKPKPKPTAKPSPKPTAKPRPKPTAKKTVLAKASPKPSPKLSPTPEAPPDDPEEVTSDVPTNEVTKATPPPDPATQPTLAAKQESNEEIGGAKAATPGDGGHGTEGGHESQFGWYGSMLHDRFYSEWIQPSAVASSKTKTSVLVKIRIEKDGRVSKFETIRPSGNAAIDESIAAISKRVTEVDPLPQGLGNGGHYDVKINFELNSEQ